VMRFDAIVLLRNQSLFWLILKNCARVNMTSLASWGGEEDEEVEVGEADLGNALTFATLDMLLALGSIEPPGDEIELYDNLRLDPYEWMEYSDRCAYALFQDNVWMANAKRTRHVVELLFRQGRARKPGRRVTADQLVYGHCCLRFSDGELCFLKIPPENVEKAEKLLGRIFDAIDDAQDEGGRIEVYVPPPRSASFRRDAWWSCHYVKIKKNKTLKASDAYRHYRNDIDDIILQAIRSRVIRGKSMSLRVAELCAGDGSLAEKFLQTFGGDTTTEESVRVESYIMIERNSILSKESIRKAQCITESPGCATTEINSLTIDVCTVDGLETIAEMDPKVNLWIAAGSVLCGQVGSEEMAQPVLAAMSSSLDQNGYALITGFTQSFLTPSLLASVGLRVMHASIPSSETNGLDSGFGRFHVFVLKRLGDDDKTATQNGIDECSDFLRRVMMTGAAATIT
jgi:hypothetical protein